MVDTVRALVSKKKKRFIQDGFNLDLTYITPRVIAMGFPSTGVEAVYRNPMPEVQRFFETRHKGHYKIYNLCSERAYDLTTFFPNVERFPFDDHGPCACDLLGPFCANVDQYLAEDPANVVAIHCKAGKGRTGLMIATYLLHSSVCNSADASLEKFGVERTHNSKGVTIPSQMRYVHYYEQLLRRKHCPVFTYQVTHVRMITVPSFDSAITGGGCDPYFRVLQYKKNNNLMEWKWKTIYDFKAAVKKLRHFGPDTRYVDLDCSSHALKIRGDVKIVFYDADQYKKDDKMCHLVFNTAFIENNYLCFEKSVIDKAAKDKHHKLFDAGFKIEIFLHKLDDLDADQAAESVFEQTVDDDEDEDLQDEDEEDED